MTAIDAAVLILAGMAAGTINTVVGSGSLVTFPVLLAMGYPPVLANVTNNVGVLPGTLSGALAYRSHFRGQRRLLLILLGCAAAGGMVGAVLLLTLPAEMFDAVVPLLIIFACVLVMVGPAIKSAIARRRGPDHLETDDLRAIGPGTFATAIYGGYFGAAQGVILISLLSVGMKGSIHRANAFKNVLGAAANFFAALVFLFTTPVSWPAAGLIAAGAITGGYIGGHIGQRIPPLAYRLVIVAIGITAVIYFYV